MRPSSPVYESWPWRDDPPVGQTLADWQARPRSLKGEIYAPHLRFVGRQGEFLLFRMAYVQRHPDWLALNSETGEVRRFVEVTAMEIMEDLIGVRSASGQEDFAERWGRTQPIGPGRWSRRVQDDQRFERFLRAAGFPVYGFVNEVVAGFRLGAASTSQASNARGPVYAGLVFVEAQHRGLGVVAVGVQSWDPLHRPVEPFGGLVLSPFSHQPPRCDSVLPLRINSASSQVTLMLSRETFYGYVSQLASPLEPVRFVLRSRTVMLAGAAVGVNSEQALALLHCLEPIQDRPPVLQRYELEIKSSIADHSSGPTPELWAVERALYESLRPKNAAKEYGMGDLNCRVAGSIAAPGSHRTGREPLDSSGSCHPTYGRTPNRQCTNKLGS